MQSLSIRCLCSVRIWQRCKQVDQQLRHAIKNDPGCSKRLEPDQKREKNLSTKEATTTRDESQKQHEIDEAKNSNECVQPKSLHSPFGCQVLYFSLGLFGRFSHLPDIIVCTLELMALCVHLSQDRIRCGLSIVLSFDGIMNDISLLFSVRPSRGDVGRGALLVRLITIIQIA